MPVPSALVDQCKPNVFYNIYDTTETGKCYTSHVKYRHKAEQVKEEKAKEWGVTKDDVFQCDSTMWCCLQSNTMEMSNWKFVEKSGKVEAYKTWLANKGEGVPATLLPEALSWNFGGKETN